MLKIYLTFILSLIFYFATYSACQISVFPYWDCSDDNNCGYFKSCRKTGTWPDFLCICVDLRCETYNLTTGLCTLCQSGTVPTKTGNYCSPIIPNCNVYKDDYPDGFCQTCLIGYTVTEGGACSQNITNCTSYSNPGQCKICNQGYVLFNNNTQCVPASEDLKQPYMFEIIERRRVLELELKN